MVSNRILSRLGVVRELALERGASLVITDSGGVQEETTFLGVPYLAIRSKAGRGVTVTALLLRSRSVMTLGGGG